MTIPDADLEETRAALKPTLDATASILPWVAKPRPPRFAPQLAERWQAAWSQLAAAWSERHGTGFAAIRPGVFELCAVALELHDPDCLHLSESLATATDRLDGAEGLGDAVLVAAITAAIECFSQGDSLEHDAFPERVRHFASRLERCARASGQPVVRSPVLDRLFAEEGRECVERMRDAALALPPDAYALKAAAADLNRVAEAMELDAIALIASRLVRLLTLRAGEHLDLEAQATRQAAEALIAALEKAIAELAA